MRTFTVRHAPALRVGFAVMALAYLMPGHYLPWTAFEPQAVAAVGFVLLVSTVLFGYKTTVLRPGAIGYIALALAFVPPVQWATGQVMFFSDALLPTLYLVGLALAVVVGRRLAERQGTEVRSLLFHAIALAAAFSAAIAWAQWLQQSSVIPMAVPAQPGGRSWGNLGQPNHLATLLALGVVATVDAYERRRIDGVASTFVVALLGGAMVMSQSRTGWLCTALLGAWWLFQRRRAGLRLHPAAVLVAWTAFFSLAFAWEDINAALLLDSPSLAERLAPGTRLIHWHSLLDAVSRKPWLGYGWNQVSVAQLAVAVDHPATGEALLDAHNAFLDLLLWCGIPLGLAVAALVVGWFARRIAASRDLTSTQLLAAFGVIGVHGLLEYPLDYTYFLLPWGMVIGMVDALGPQPAAPAGTVAAPRLASAVLPLSAARALCLVCAAALGVVIVEYLRVDAAARDLRLQMAGINGAHPTLVAPPDVRWLDAPREFHRYATTPAREGMAPAELQWMRRVMLRHPYPPALLRYALASGLNGRLDEAALTLERLCRIHPRKRCEEGRESWQAAVTQHPRLATVPLPALPPPLPAELLHR